MDSRMKTGGRPYLLAFGFFLVLTTATLSLRCALQEAGQILPEKPAASDPVIVWWDLVRVLIGATTFITILLAGIGILLHVARSKFGDIEVEDSDS